MSPRPVLVFFVILHNLFLAIVPAIEFLLRLVEGEEDLRNAAIRDPRHFASSSKKISIAEFSSLSLSLTFFKFIVLSRISLRVLLIILFLNSSFLTTPSIWQFAFAYVSEEYMS